MQAFEENIESLIWKHLNAQLEPEELDFLEIWLEQAENQDIYSSIWKLNLLQKGIASDENKFDVDEAWNCVEARIGIREIPVGNNRWFYAAFGFAATFVIGIMIWWLSTQTVFSGDNYTSYTAIDSTLEIQLSDGSLIALKSGSELTLADTFNETNRLVKLKGEAFFEVFRDTLKPFLVNTSNSFTEVLGTSFLIREMSDGGTEMEVFSGKVKFGSNLNQKFEILTKSQSLRIDNDGKISHKLLHDMSNPLYWKNLELVYFNTPVDSVFSELEMLFDLSINYDVKAVRNCSFTARFEKPIPEKVIEVLCSQMDWQYFNTGNTFIINNKDCE